MTPDAPLASAAGVALASLTAHVLGLANDAHRLLKLIGRDDLAKRLDNEARRWRGTSTLVVVAGEVKRGKSTLVNALLDRPGLSPPHITAPTSAPLIIAWATEPSATVERCAQDFDQPERLKVGLEQLATYAMGTPEAVGVQRIDVRLPAPLLEGGLVLIDTPGIGSMTAGHRDLVLGLLHDADTLLFAISVEDPMLRSEAEFLAIAAGHVADVEIVATKADLAADPSAIAARVQARLGQLAGALPESAASGAGRLRELAERPPKLTSTLLSERASVAADPTRAAALLERSGIPALQAALRSRVEDATRARLANAAQTTAITASLGLAELTPREPGNAPAPNPKELAALIARVSTQAQRRLTGELNDLETRHRERVEESTDPAALVRDLSTELEAALQAVWLNVLATVDDALHAASARALDADVAALPDRIRQATTGRPIKPAKTKVDAMEHGIPALAVSASLGFALSRLLEDVISDAPAMAVGGLTGVAVGAGSIAVRAKRQAKTKTRQQAAAAVRDAVREARTEFASELQSALNGHRAALERHPATPPGTQTGATADVIAELKRIAADADAIRRQLR